MRIKTIIFGLLLIAFAFQSYGRVIFKSTNISHFPAKMVDINDDGLTDFKFDSYRLPEATTNFTCPSPPLNYLQHVQGTNFFFESVGGPVFSQPTNSFYAEGVSISTQSTFGAGGANLGAVTEIWFTPSNCGGQTFMPNLIHAPFNQNGYIGIKFTINGLTHYGWIQMSGNIIVGVAYESIPGFPIVTANKVGYFSEQLNPTANRIKGKIYVDANSNCAYNAGEKVVENMIVFTTSGNYAAVTDANGNYEIFVPGGTATYNVDLNILPYLGLSFSKVCPTGTVACSFTGNNQTSLNNNFSITTSACSNIIIAIKSERRRRCFRNNTLVTYENKSIIASSAATIKVVLPQFLRAISSTPAWNSQSGDTLIYNVSSLTPFSKSYIRIIDSVICGDESIRSLNQCTKAMISPVGYCNTPGTWDQSDLFISGSCTNSNFIAVIKNVGSNMTDSVSYRIFLDGLIVKNKKIKLTAGQSFPLSIPCLGKALRIEVDQRSTHPECELRALNFEGCGNFITETISKGINSRFPMQNLSYSEATDCQPIRDSYDPNDKQANPVGFDSDHKILPDGELEYTIRFQNTGNDVAYTVVVADTLDADLDPGSLRTIAASHPYTLEVTSKVNSRLVWVFGGINLPDSISNEPASHGYVTFRVSQMPGLTQGTVIKNKAHIYFDYNSAIITNELSQTIHTNYPSDLLRLNTQPSPVNACTNTNHTLSSVGAGWGNLNYLWFKDNTSLLTNTPDHSMSNVSTNDAGTYKCRIENGVDTIFTNNVLVNIQDYPSLSTTDPIIPCNTNGDITSAFVDNNNTDGTVSYWVDANATTPLVFPNSISNSGTYYVRKETSLGCSDIQPVNVGLSICTNTIDALSQKFNIRYYPNPTKENIYIECKSGALVSIVDNSGIQVHQKLLIPGTNHISIADLSSGMYVLKFTIDNKCYSTTFIKQ